MHKSSMDPRGALYGFGERGDDREATAVALARAMRAIAVLDTEVDAHRLRAPWLRLEREIALAAAMREIGPKSIMRVF